MVSASATRPLLTLCKGQHHIILELLHRLTGPEEPQLDRDKRLQIVQSVRQRLSRHLQLMRHGFYPPLRQQGSEDQELESQIKHFEEATAKLVPQATQFLHQAERNPGESCQSKATEMYRKLKSHFQIEQQQLHVLYSQHVPLALEQKQLQIFRKRLLVTLSRDTSVPAHSSNNADPRTPSTRRPTDWELDREAITRPVLPGETFWPSMSSADPVKLATT